MQFNRPIIDFLGSRVKLAMLGHLLYYGKVDFSEREFARLLGVSNFAVNQAMKDFERANIIETHRIGRIKLWRIKKNSYYVQLLTPIFKHLVDSPNPIMHLTTTIRSNLDLAKISRIYLYGSIAEKTSAYNSDIDLFIIAKNASDLPYIEETCSRLGLQCLDLYGNRLQAIVVSGKKFKTANRHLKEAVRKGICIHPQ